MGGDTNSLQYRLNKDKIQAANTERAPPALPAAMRSGTGASVVNGRWAVDPPGDYQAGGTTFTYTRPRGQSEGEEQRGESLTAPGPTSTQLQLYVSSGEHSSAPTNINQAGQN